MGLILLGKNLFKYRHNLMVDLLNRKLVVHDEQCVMVQWHSWVNLRVQFLKVLALGSH